MTVHKIDDVLSQNQLVSESIVYQIYISVNLALILHCQITWHNLDKNGIRLPTIAHEFYVGHIMNGVWVKYIIRPFGPNKFS